MVCMTFHISTQFCLFERVALVQAEESTETYRFKSCWFSETACDQVGSLVCQLWFFVVFSLLSSQSSLLT